jgi:hypothetical protein
MFYVVAGSAAEYPIIVVGGAKPELFEGSVLPRIIHGNEDGAYVDMELISVDSEHFTPMTSRAYTLMEFTPVLRFKLHDVYAAIRMEHDLVETLHMRREQARAWLSYAVKNKLLVRDMRKMIYQMIFPSKRMSLTRCYSNHASKNGTPPRTTLTLRSRSGA